MTAGPCIKFAWGSLALLLVLLLTHVWSGPDIWYHLYLGANILKTQSLQIFDNLILKQPSFVNIYWLFQILCEGVYRILGPFGLTTLFWGFWLAIGYLWVKITRAHTSFLGLPLALLAMLMAHPRFEHRPEILSYLFLMTQLHWLVRWDFNVPLSKSQFAKFIAIEILWANVHGYFVFGPALVAIKLLHIWLQGHIEARRNLTKLFVLTILATLISPHGFNNWTYVATLARFLKEMGPGIWEFKSPTGIYLELWTVWIFWGLWIGTAMVGLYYVWQGPRRLIFPLILAALGLFFSMNSIRNIPLLPLLASPLWRELLQHLGTSHKGLARSCLVTTTAACALTAWVLQGGFHRSLSSDGAFGLGMSEASYPLRFKEYLQTQSFTGPLFNVSSDGGYLEYHFPELILYGDSRFTEIAPVRAYFAAAINAQDFYGLHNQNAFRGVLLRLAENSPLIGALLNDPQWTLAYADLHRVFFLHQSMLSKDREEASESISFYQGQDLTLKIHGKPAIEWLRVLTATDQRDLVMTALEEYATAKQIPSFILEYAIEYGIMKADEDILYQTLEMRPKMLALQPADAKVVDDLIRTFKR